LPRRSVCAEAGPLRAAARQNGSAIAFGLPRRPPNLIDALTIRRTFLEQQPPCR